jgi:hypothetical protein
MLPRKPAQRTCRKRGSVNGRYTYTAYASLLYPSFSPWGIRACNTAATCSGAWTSVQGTWIDDYRQKITRSLTVDCNFAGKKVYQVRRHSLLLHQPLWRPGLISGGRYRERLRASGG